MQVNTPFDSVFLRTVGRARCPGTHPVEIQPPLPVETIAFGGAGGAPPVPIKRGDA